MTTELFCVTVFSSGAIPPKTSDFSFHKTNNINVKRQFKLYPLSRNFGGPLSLPGSCGEDTRTYFVSR
jgi:hypothetical protein